MTELSEMASSDENGKVTFNWPLIEQTAQGPDVIRAGAAPAAAVARILLAARHEGKTAVGR